MGQIPIVSVITPAYNSALYIGDAIESVRSQSFEFWEMIVVDDSSDDDTRRIVKGYAAIDHRIKLICQAKKGGPAKARNAALNIASGKYIAFLDSDDLWLPKKLELQVLFMKKRNIAFSYTLYRRFFNENDQLGDCISLPPSLTYGELLKNTGIACLTVMIDTALTGPIRMEEIHHEDYALWLKILKNKFVAYGLMEDLARYRITKNSISANKLKSAWWVWLIYRDIEKLNLFYAFWCLFNYGCRAFRKHNL